MTTKRKNNNTRNFRIQKQLIEQFFNKEYSSYAEYVLENRALPSIIDGLKPGARKIMNAAFKILSESKVSSFLDLTGSTLSLSKYHHGDSSLETTIITLGSYFRNNLYPIVIEGTGGSLRSTESASPRYLDVTLSKYAKLLKHNENILEYNYDGDTKVEPKHYLPIIPLVLANRTSGIAVGYMYLNEISYSPLSLVKSCIEYLKTEKLKSHLIPHINEYDGTYVKTKEGKIYCRGKYDIDLKKNVVNIYEFSPMETFSSFEDNLIKQETEPKLMNITSWENISGDNKTHYKVYFTKEKLEKLIKSKKLEYTLKISSYFRKSNLVMLNENNKLIEFSNHEDILRYFVEYRLNRYETLKDVILNDITEQILKASELMQFIDLYLKGKVKINNKISIDKVIKVLESYKLPSYLIETKLSKLTKEEYDKLKQKIEELEKEYNKIKNTTPKELYLSDLLELQKELSKDFKETKLEIISEKELNESIN